MPNTFNEISHQLRNATIEERKRIMLENPNAIMSAVDIASTQRIRSEEETKTMRRKIAEKDVRREDRRQFCMSNADDGGRYDAISLADIGALFNLTQFLVTNKGGLLIAKREHTSEDGNGNKRYAPEMPLSVKDIQKALGNNGKLRSRKATYKTITELEKIGALCRDSTARPTLFYIEESIIKAGEGAFKNFVKIYRVEAKKLLNRLSHREAGAVFKLMKYAHKDTFVLCENPQEFDPKKVKPLNGRELAEKLGVAYKTFRNIMTKLMNAGAMLSVSSIYTDVAGRNYIINPRVCNRGVLNNPYECGITKLFDQITAKLEKQSVN